MLVLISFLASVMLALVHLFAGQLRFLHGIPRSRWLSIAGGASVAYVFVHLLPELSEGQEAITRAVGEALAFLEHHVYLVALLGLVTFYGLERAAKVSRQRKRATGEGDITSSSVFWLHIVSFSAYNALIGYFLLHREEQDVVTLTFFAVVIALHFAVNDYGLRHHHKHLYTGIGRWLLAAAIFLGWVLGLLTAISEAALAVLLAFLAGGIILNVLKEELPAERESRFGAFALGAGTYTALLLVL